MSTATADWPLYLVLDAGTPVGAAMSLPPPADESSLEAWKDVAGQDYGYCVEAGDSYYVHIYGIGRFAFTRHSRLVHGTPEPDVPEQSFRLSFYRELAPLVLQKQSWEVLHASGIVIGGACVALCGDSEMGKSTLAHAWQRRGGRIYADDAIPFRVDGHSVPLCLLPFHIRLRSLARSHFGVTAMGPGPELDSAQELASSSPPALRAVYLLERRKEETDGPVCLAVTPPEKALPALLKQAYCLTLRDPQRNRQMVEMYIRLMNSVPIFDLSYPTGVGHVESILDHLAAHTVNEVIGDPAGEESDPCRATRQE